MVVLRQCSPCMTRGEMYGYHHSRRCASVRQDAEQARLRVESQHRAEEAQLQAEAALVPERTPSVPRTRDFC